MKEICILRNPVHDYAWGSHTAIPELFGEPSPSKRPQAELWMGAHPKAPSEALVGGNWEPLTKLIEKYASEILGKGIVKKFGGQLPFLFKVIAAATPLSIQTHPDLNQAREGFARENSLGIPLTAPSRNYKDNNHKPETICALKPFWALNGFRRISDIVSTLSEINPSEISAEIGDLAAHADLNGLKRFFRTIMTMQKARQARAAEQTVDFAEKRASKNPVFEWMVKLHTHYPGDIGVLSPALLNLVKLEPGQAMFLHARELHTYLDGMGIEVMANSDNVLRGGLTPKHIDVTELLRILDFSEKEVVILTPEDQGEGETTYPSEADEFRLSVITVDVGRSYNSPEDRSVEIMICIGGEASVRDLQGDKALRLQRGTSILIPAAVQQYRIEGEAKIYKASVP